MSRLMTGKITSSAKNQSMTWYCWCLQFYFQLMSAIMQPCQYKYITCSDECIGGSVSETLALLVKNTGLLLITIYAPTVVHIIYLIIHYTLTYNSYEVHSSLTKLQYWSEESGTPFHMTPTRTSCKRQNGQTKHSKGVTEPLTALAKFCQHFDCLCCAWIFTTEKTWRLEMLEKMIAKVGN